MQLTADEIPELLARLVDKSLVQYDPDTDRYSLLQLVTEFAREETMRGNEWSELRLKHLSYNATMMEGARVRTTGPDQIEELKKIETEYENLRVANEWALAAPDLWPQAYLIARELLVFWATRSYVEEGIKWMAAIIECAPEEYRYEVADLTCRVAAFMERSHSNDFQSWLDRGIQLAERSNNSEALARAFLSKSIYEWRAGNMAETREFMEQAVHIASEINSAALLPAVIVALGNLDLFEDRLEDATANYQKVRELWQATGNNRGLGVVNGNLGQIFERRGDYQKMYSCELDALKCFMPLQDKRNIAGSIGGCASGFLIAGDYATAAQMLGCSEGILQKHGDRIDNVDAQTLNRIADKVKAHMGEEAFEASFHQGMQLSAEAAFEFLVANPEPWVKGSCS
jgi:hypothetical protein